VARLQEGIAKLEAQDTDVHQDNKQERQELRDTARQELETAWKAGRDEVSRVQAEHHAAMTIMRSEHAAEVARVKEDSLLQLRQYKDAFEERIADVRARADKELRAAGTEARDTIAYLEGRLAECKEAAQRDNEIAKDELHKAHEDVAAAQHMMEVVADAMQQMEEGHAVVDDAASPFGPRRGQLGRHNSYPKHTT